MPPTNISDKDRLLALVSVPIGYYAVRRRIYGRPCLGGRPLSANSMEVAPIAVNRLSPVDKIKKIAKAV